MQIDKNFKWLKRIRDQKSFRYVHHYKQTKAYLQGLYTLSSRIKNKK